MAAERPNVLDVIVDAADAYGHEQGEGYADNDAGVLGEPQQETRLNLKGEEGNIGRRGEQEPYGDGSADDAHHKGYYHRHFVTAECGLLILTDVLHSIQAFAEASHKLGLIIEMGRLGEKDVLECFVLFHNFQFSTFNFQLLFKFVTSARELLLYSILRGVSNLGNFFYIIAAQVEEGDGGSFLRWKGSQGQIEALMLKASIGGRGTDERLGIVYALHDAATGTVIQERVVRNLEKPRPEPPLILIASTGEVCFHQRILGQIVGIALITTAEGKQETS